MSQRKKEIRAKFRYKVFKRDNYTCAICGKKWSHKDSDPNLGRINAHHITDRSEMPNGGYVPENGITVCDGGPESCHMRVEQWHITRSDPERKGGQRVEEGLHPDDLYDMINSNFEIAWVASSKLSLEEK